MRKKGIRQATKLVIKGEETTEDLNFFQGRIDNYTLGHESTDHISKIVTLIKRAARKIGLSPGATFQIKAEVTLQIIPKVSPSRKSKTVNISLAKKIVTVS